VAVGRIDDVRLAMPAERIRTVADAYTSVPLGQDLSLSENVG
jgi:hypothetical protein